MSHIYVIGVGMTRFGRHDGRSIASLLGEAVGQALADASCDKSQVETVFHASATQGFLQGQNLVPGQIALAKCGIKAVPISNVENACASGATAFHLAALDVSAGAHDIALAVGVEKMVIEDRSKMFSVFDSGWDVESPEENAHRLMALGEGVAAPEGSESEKPYSIFMKVYAAFGRDHIRRYGTTQRQIAAISAKNHAHSVHNDRAQYRRAYTIDEILAAPAITYPLTLPMCSPISDGAAAAVVCNEDGLKKLGLGKARAVRLLASAIASGDPERSADEPEMHVARRAAERAYEVAGIGPKDVQVCECHDATAIGELMHAENLMLVRPGEAGPAAERGEFSLGGRIPINPSGGLESKGHPIGATGLAQLFELATQLRGEAGKRQVVGAKMAIHENSGGLLGIEEASAVVNILSAGNA